MKWPWWVVALLLALLTRWLYVAEIADYILFRVPLIDAEEYMGWAAGLVAGAGEAPDVYYKAPLYPWLLSFWMRLFGTNILSAVSLNIMLGALNVVLLGVWCRRIVGPRWGLVGAMVAALFGPSFFFAAQVLPATLSMTLATASLLLLDELRRRTKPAQPALVLATGVVLGLLTLARPTFLLWIPCAAILLWWFVAPRQGKRHAAGRSLLLCVSALLIILPVTLRNRQVGGAWVLVSANAGINFFLGNNADAHHTSRMRSGIEWEVLVSSLPETERQGQARWDRWFARQAMVWMRDHPLDFVRGLGHKALQYVHAHPIDRNLDARGFRQQSLLLRVAPSTAWLAPWILLGFVVAVGRRGSAAIAASFMATLFVATVAVFVAERYKLDALPGTLPLALLGVRETIAQIRRQGRELPVVLAPMLVLIGAVLAFHGWGNIRTLHPAHAATLEGVAFYKERQWLPALERLQLAVQEEPQDADAHMTLGTTLQQLGRLPQALTQYQRTHQLIPRHPRPLLNSGWIQRAQGDLTAARISFEAAIQLDSGSARAHFELATVLEVQGNRQDSMEHYAAAERLATDSELANNARQRFEYLRHRLAP